jgi:hypothetical protein
MEVFSVGFFYFLSFQMMIYLNIWMSCYEDVVNLIIGLDELFQAKFKEQVSISSIIAILLMQYLSFLPPSIYVKYSVA